MKRTTLLAILTMAFLACGREEAPVPTVTTRPTEPEVKVEPAANASPEEMIATAITNYGARALDGSTYRVSDQKGKVLLINAWATWCGPCRYEIPELKRLHDAYSDKGLEIVGVSVDMGPAEPVVRQFVEVNKIEYPILLDPESRLTAALRTMSIPTSVMLDRDGNVIWRHIGIVSEKGDQTFREALARALGS